ncbi:tetratricopeptide repeat protein [Massilia eburnea]|nr:tetratricopeptide repeat protein [Massilia eburnea]
MKILLVVLALLTGSAAMSNESEYNQGVESFRAKDYSNARVHWQAAVTQNVRAAHNNLGYLFYYGLGGAPDQERAVELWTIAAKNGDREAQWHLAVAFEEGNGMNQDLVSAYAWYRCADANFAAAPLIDQADAETVKDVKSAIVRLVAKLSIDQVRDSEGLARKYIEAYPYSSKWLLPETQSMN